MTYSGFTALFGTATAQRVGQVEQFVRASRALCAGELESCDLGVSRGFGLLVVMLRLEGAARSAAQRERLEFWTRRCGGVAAWDASAAAADSGLLSLCDLRETAVPPFMLAAALERLLAGAGLARDADTRLWIDLDLGARQGDGLRYDAASRSLFVPALRSPPVGDAVGVRLAPADGGAPWTIAGAVSGVRRAGAAGPGAPAGFTVAVTRIDPGVHAALSARTDLPAEGRAARGAPRYRVRLPARIGSGAGRDDVATMENLSQGGAFLRCAAGWAIGESVRVDAQLPWGPWLRMSGSVRFVGAAGVGVAFDADPQADAELGDALERLGRRPRRALVVDDDPLARRMLGDALVERAFAVRAADEGRAGLRMLIDDLLETDVLVTDVLMPGMDGPTFVSTIRRSGGEHDLAIVVVTGSWTPELDERMRAAGADAVLDKRLGAEIAARVAEAIVDRRQPERVGQVAAEPAAAAG